MTISNIIFKMSTVRIISGEKNLMFYILLPLDPIRILAWQSFIWKCK